MDDLLAGRLIEIASTPDFFERPRDPLTAAFVCGDMMYSNPIGFVNVGRDFSRGCAPNPRLR